MPRTAGGARSRVFFGVCTIVLILALPATAAGPTEVTKVIASASSIEVYGQSFGNSPGFVEVEGLAIPIISWTDTHIVAVNPGYVPGSYRLAVRKNNGNNSNSTAVIFEFAIGTTGATGAAGAIGATGASGATGAAGAMGASGAAGAPGLTGAQGAAGAIGPAGTTGAVGAIGAAGATGAAGVLGPAGATGAVGTAGAAGAIGPTGAGGATGAVGAAGANGTDGTNGTAGATGAAGANGTNGAMGPGGTNGTNGVDGAPGATGSPGSQYPITGGGGTAFPLTIYETHYIGTNSNSPAEGDVQVLMPAVATFTNLWCRVSVAQPGYTTFTLRVEGSPSTGSTCTVPAGKTGAYWAASAYPVSAGDLIDVELYVEIDTLAVSAYWGLSNTAGANDSHSD